MRKIGKGLYIALIMFFLYLPIGFLIVLSFNEGRSMAAWTGFSFHWFEEMFESRMIMDALYNTFTIALGASLAATAIGVLACIGLQAMGYKSRQSLLTLNNIPMLNADIVTGISLMLTFVAFGISLNYETIMFSHICFCIPYVILSVLPKFKEIGDNTFEAALDLGATKTKAFIKVILPEIMPGILSGFLLAFTMSVDDFVITHFTRGAGINTLSTLIYSQVKVGVRPTLYALSTVIFVVILIVLVLTNIISSKREKRRLEL
ncbi:MAG: ABC transporter permease [Clostridia bacterium]|nr:ABC transporter permease [Clostridia bacterium]